MRNSIIRLIGRILNGLVVFAPQTAGEAGFRLFCRPLRPRLSEQQREFLTRGKRFTFPCGRETIQAYSWGTGPNKVLFLHGWQSNAYRWKKYIDALDPEQFTAYAIDAPAHGLSTGHFMSVPFYSEAIAEMISRTGSIDTIVGHSVGAFTTLYTLFEKPVLTPKSLVILASPGNAEEFIALFREQLDLSQKMIDATIRRFKQYAGKTPDYFSAITFAKSIRCPGLIIHDDTDKEALVDNARAIHAAWKKSQLLITSGLGHNLRSPVIVEKVAEWVATHRSLITLS